MINEEEELNRKLATIREKAIEANSLRLQGQISNEQCQDIRNKLLIDIINLFDKKTKEKILDYLEKEVSSKQIKKLQKILGYFKENNIFKS